MKNQILITLDSLRWDVFNQCPGDLFLKKFDYAKAFTHVTYTLPAHTAFFTGKLPCNFKGKYDTCARSGRRLTGQPQWRLMNPESDGPAIIKLQGKDIVDGFNKKGYFTIGTGAVGWFNHNKPAHIPVIDNFQSYMWFGEFIVARQQTAFVSDQIQQALKHKQPYFAFINFGETHHSYRINSSSPAIPYGNHERCFMAQSRCLVYLDKLIKDFIDPLENVDIIICSDHGDCMGENGLWGHSFFHEKVIEVPIVKISK